MRIEVVFESDIKMLQIKMTSVSCLIYCFDEITGQALQIRKSHFQVFKNADADISSKVQTNKIFSRFDTKRSIDQKKFRLSVIDTENRLGKLDIFRYSIQTPNLCVSEYIS